MGEEEAKGYIEEIHSKNIKYFQEPFLVLQYLEEPQQEYWGPAGQKTFLLWFFPVLIGPSRY